MKHKNLLQLAMTLLLAMVSTGSWAQWKWVGSDGDPKVDMEIDDGYDEYGSWYTFDDNGEGGISRVVWAAEPDEDGSFTTLVTNEGGMSGTAVLDKGNIEGTLQPFTGVGLYVAGIKDGVVMTADVSAWLGIVIYYESAADVKLQLVPNDDISLLLYSDEYGYAYPEVTLSKSTGGTVKSLLWSAFQQPSWYKGTTKINGEETATQLAKIQFKIQNSAGNYTFNIRGIGSYGCGLTPSIPSAPPFTVTTNPGTANAVTVNFPSLQAALNAAQNGALITLNKDYAVPADNAGLIDCNVGTQEKPVVLDLKGHTLSFPNGGEIVVNLGHALTIRDSGTGGKITSGKGYVINNTGTGTLRIEGGTLESTFTGDGNEEVKGAVYNLGTMYVDGGTISGQKYGIYSSGILAVSGGTISGSIGIESAASSSSECHLLALPTFNCTAADISLAKDQKISFSGDITTAPTKKIKVKVANTAPYMFTDGYGYHVWNDVDGTLDPETVFEYYDKDAGLSFDLDGNGSNGADVVIAQRYALSSTNVRFYHYFNDGLYPIKKAAAGQTVYIGFNEETQIPEGQYFTGTFSTPQLVPLSAAKDDGRGLPSGTYQFTMPAMAVTVSANFAEQEEYTIAMNATAPTVIPELVSTLLAYMEVGGKDCNIYDAAGNWYLDLNVDGKKDVEVKDRFDEATQQYVYSIEWLIDEGVYAKNCHITLNTPTPERYKSLFFQFIYESALDESKSFEVLGKKAGDPDRTFVSLKSTVEKLIVKQNDKPKVEIKTTVALEKGTKAIVKLKTKNKKALAILINQGKKEKATALLKDVGKKTTIKFKTNKKVAVPIHQKDYVKALKASTGKVIKLSRAADGGDADEEEIESGVEYEVLEDCDLFLDFISDEDDDEDIEIESIMIRRPGDANNDGFLDAVDLVEMVNAKEGKPTGENFSLLNADINEDGDGEVDQEDIDTTVKLIMDYELE